MSSNNRFLSNGAMGSSEAMSLASDPETSPPYSSTQVALAEWDQPVKAAWSAFRNAESGDEVIWGSRAKPLTVVNKEMDDEGQVDLEVEGPRGGTYRLRERYDEQGNPRFYADDSRAMDLRLVGDEPEETPFTEPMYENLVKNLVRASVTAYVEQDYNQYADAVGSVTQSWAEDVAFQRWRGWPFEWQDDHPRKIFEAVIGFASGVEEPEGQSPKAKARNALTAVVLARGRELAHEQLITSQEDYNAVVARLAEDAVERADLKAHLDPREAALSISEDFVEAHTDPVHRAIVRYGESDWLDFELYDNLEDDTITQEMAVDVLDRQVWEQARSIHEERGTHDPTIRGLAFWEYDQLVEVLVEEALKEHAINDNRMLYTTAREVVRRFADTVESQNWPYDFGGITAETWGAGDVEDIFTSITMHSEVDPQVFNPFASDKERRMATQVLSEVVHNRASNALDEEELANAPVVPADEYLDDIGIDMSFNDIREDSGITPQEFIRGAMEAMEGNDLSKLAGWTFADELVEQGGATVTYAAGPWILVDYGLVTKDDKDRRLAYFNRDTGGVLKLAGQTTAPPSDGGYGFAEDGWNVTLTNWRENEPRYLVNDASLQYAFKFISEYVGGDESDINVIESADGKHYIREAITEDDIDSRPFSGIAPSFSMPGPDFSIEDAFTYGTQTLRELGGKAQRNSRLVSALTTSAVALYLGEIPYLMYRYAPGLNIEPTFDKKKGVGLQGSYQFGQDSSEWENYNPEDPDSKFYTGRIQSDIYITPGTFRFIGDSFTPDWVYRGRRKGDTVIKSLVNNIERPIRDATGGFGRRQRAVFLGAHLHEGTEGKPKNADEYDERVEVEVRGLGYTTQYSHTGTGDHLSRGEVKEMLMRLVNHGYDVPSGKKGYHWKGDLDFVDEMDLPEPTRSTVHGEAQLKPAEVHELGWSMTRDMVLGPKKERLVGTVEECKEGWDNETGPVCTDKAFIKVFSEFYGTPSNSMLDTVWKFYKSRAEDSDEFTLYDAYDRFRMGLVYDAAQTESMRVTADHLQKAARDGKLELKFQKTTDKEYWWQAHGPLAAENVFDEDSAPIGPWLIFTKNNRPPQKVDHYYYDEDEGGYFHYIPGSGAEPYNPSGDYSTPSERRTHHLSTQKDVYSALLPSVRNDIADEVAADRIVTDNKEYDPENWSGSDEERKWLNASERDRVRKVAQGTVRWDDLDGTDLSVFGLFMRGLTMQDAVDTADRWNLKDRFRTRFSDVLPQNLEPERPDLPSFTKWMARRRGRNAIGSTTDKARQKARYLREMAETIPGVQSGEAMGTSPTVEEEIEMMRDVREHHEDTDYTDYEQFYANEFGEAFDDVAQKFARQRPYDDSNTPDTE